MGYFLQVLLALTPVLVSGVTFHLSYQRVDNQFYLTCDVNDGTIQPEFWINETEKTYILSKADRVSLRYSIIAFKLEQQYEGTFYCGEATAGQSNGLGPFAGKLMQL